MAAPKRDPLALLVARALHAREKPQATILFGSRARGDHEEGRSDIDIMLVMDEEPDPEHRKSSARWAEERALEAYGREMPVQLVWFGRAEFEESRRYINQVATRAMLDGVIMAGNPEEFRSRYEDEETEHEYEWTTYSERLRHAEEHLDLFELADDSGRSDTMLGQQAQGALEHALKAIIYGHGGTARDTHDIGRLLGSVRRIDTGMEDFRLSIPPDIYSEYAGEGEYRNRRTQPLITGQENYRERTVADATALIEHARQLGPNMYP